MNDKPETKIGYISPLKRICMTIGELPSSYLETMSYYEMLVWFVEFLKNQVIPVVNNNSLATQELQNLFTELQNYVNNYFDNLDVQEEINNKLDEMAEDGSLQEIISAYLNSKAIFGFDTVSSMIASENLIDGSYARTYGFNQINDGLGAFYKIREKLSSDIIDGYTIVNMNDALVAEIIKDNTIKYYCLTKSSATNIIQFQNGKNLVIDTGKVEEWSEISTAISNLGITKFDYMILTHFHSDHIGNLNNFLNTYDFSDCVCWVGMKPDFVNHSSDIDELESNYDNIINLLESYDISPIVPNNDSYYEIDNFTKLHFLNTSSEIAENYYNSYTEYRDEPGVNFNVFSLITEVIFKDNVLTFTGDIERVTEEYMSPYMHKSNVYVIPHHGVNRDCDYQFYKAVNPIYSIATYLTDSSTWVSVDKKELRTIYEIGSNIFSSHYTTATNNMLEFLCDGYNIKTTATGYGIPQDIYNIDKNYSALQSILNPTIKPYSQTTLNDVFNNLPFGSSLKIFWWDSFNTNYATLLNDIKEVFPKFTNNWEIEFYKGQTSYVKEMRAFNGNLELKAVSYNNNYNWVIEGKGLLSNVSGQTNLINTLLDLPKGQYYMSTYTPDDSVLTNSGHSINITIMGKWTQNNALQVNALINGCLRNTGTEASDSSRVIFGFINTASDPKAIWYKFNNYKG